MARKERAPHNQYVTASFVAWINRRRWQVLAAGALLTMASVWCASRLELRASLEELLPGGDPGAHAMHEAQRRMGTMAKLIVVVSSADRSANVAAAAAVAETVRGLGPDWVEGAYWRLTEVRSFLDRYRWLYAEQTLLEDVRDRLRLDIAAHENPLFVPLDEPPSWSALERRLDGAARMSALPEDGTLTTAAGDPVAVVVVPARASANEEELFHRVRRAVDKLSLPAGVSVRYSGEIASAVEERAAMAGDLFVTSLLVSILVAAIVGLYFGRLRAVPLVAVPTFAGAIVSMGLAWLVFGGVNSATAFLGAIIIGNGINYPIIILARYEEERRQRRPLDEALSHTLQGTMMPTLLAALAAALAYGSLGLTHFRGFSQFGLIGAVGMIACWLASVTLLPALLLVVDRRSQCVVRLEPRWRANLGAPFARLAGWPWVPLTVGAGLSLVSLVALPRYLGDPFEYDLRRLRMVQTGPAPEKPLDPLMGRYLTPSLLLASSREQADEAAGLIRRRAKQSPGAVEHVVTLNDLVPGTPAEQLRKIAVIEEIRRLLARPAFRLLDDEARAQLERYHPPVGLRPIGEEDLPALIRRPFLEANGQLGRVVLVFSPAQGFSLYDGRDLLRLAQLVGTVELGDGHTLHAAGRPMVFASMLRSIAQDGPRATAAAALAVAAVALLLLGWSRGSLIIMAMLLVGVLWMIGAAALLHLRVNFLNFVALPITFGIGIDYAANVYLRYRQIDGRRGAVASALASTGGAVALNSATTVIGYGTLLATHSRALRSFGALAIIGELACLTVALLVLPALLTVARRRSRWAQGEQLAGKTPEEA